MRVHYTRAAARDLEAIAVYTLEQWGEAQCAIYLDAIQDGCEQSLPRNVGVAQSVPKVPEYRRWRCLHHVIYFRVVEDGLEIVRVLHERMLPDNHL